MTARSIRTLENLARLSAADKRALRGAAVASGGFDPAGTIGRAGDACPRPLAQEIPGQGAVPVARTLRTLRTRGLIARRRPSLPGPAVIEVAAGFSPAYLLPRRAGAHLDAPASEI